MKKFFVYIYEWDDGMVYVGRSKVGVKRFNNASKYKKNEKLYNAMTTKPYRAYIVFDSDDIWKVGQVEAALIHCTWNNNYNISPEDNWRDHIQSYVNRYLTPAME